MHRYKWGEGNRTSRHSLGSLIPRIFQASKQLRSHVSDLICICTPVSPVAIACFHKYYSYCRALLRFVKARYRLCHISLDIWKPCLGAVWMVSGWFHHFPMKALIVPESHVFVEFRQLQWGRGGLSVTVLMSLCEHWKTEFIPQALLTMVKEGALLPSTQRIPLTLWGKM